MYIPSFVTIPVVPSHPWNRPSILGSGKKECHESFWIAQEPTLHSSPVGLTTSILVVIWLLRPYLPDMPLIPWLIAQPTTVPDGGPTGHPNLRPLLKSSSANWA
ncbi:MAG TPA: hypothetical protein PLC12_00320 [Candidatus Methanofastidiosa archaeon]|nr:hypothetical protein [Candidatus Methanofastidiosa archaeon]